MIFPIFFLLLDKWGISSLGDKKTLLIIKRLFSKLFGFGYSILRRYRLKEGTDFKPSSFEEFSSFGEEQQKERIKKYEDDESSILLVAEYNSELIGMIDFQNGKRKRISHKGTFGMSVRSSWRNKGVGNILLSGLVEWVKNHPTLEVISLGVIEENKSAVALYSKMGFEITGREPFGVKLSDGRFLADLAMSLRVKK